MRRTIALLVIVSGLIFAAGQSFGQLTLTGAGKLPSSAPPFTDPTSISGLQLWLDGNDQSSMTIGGGNLISQWNDKSGNARNATQATGAVQPTAVTNLQNGKNGVFFDDVRIDFMDVSSISVSQPFTIFGATITAGSVSGAFVFDDTTGTNRVLVTADDGAGHYQSSAGSTLVGATVRTGKWTIWVAVFNGASSQLFIDGSSDASGAGGSNNLTTLRIGARFSATAPLNGSIGELGGYNSVISGTNLTNLTNYLTTKWAPDP